MPNPQVNPKDAALRFTFFSALTFSSNIFLITTKKKKSFYRNEYERIKRSES